MVEANTSNYNDPAYTKYKGVLKGAEKVDLF